MNWLWKKGKETHPMVTMHSRMNELFEDFWKDFGSLPLTTTLASSDFRPKIEVKDSENNIDLNYFLTSVIIKPFFPHLNNEIFACHCTKQELNVPNF